MTDPKVKPFLLSSRATVRRWTPEDAVPEAAELELAAAAPDVTGGEPTKLLVSAWLCHEGVNENRLAFDAEDFDEAAGRISAPNLLPMDWNHSAMVPQDGVPKAIGAWYHAMKEWDPSAKNGSGAYGIFAHGMVWSWAFPEQVEQMLAVQQERGYIEFSMACLSMERALGRDEKGVFVIAKKPVFFTLSALTIPPGDKDAKGNAAFDEPGEVLYELVAAALADTHKEDPNDAEREMQTALEALMKDVNEQALETALAANKLLKESLATVEANLAEKDSKISDLASAVESAEAKALEASIAKDAFVAELESAKTKLTEIETELAAAKATVLEFETAKAQVEAEQAWTARFEELPAVYRAALAKRNDEDQARFKSRWMLASADAWDAFKTDICVSLPEEEGGFLKASKDEGALPVGGGAGSDVGSTLRKFLNK